ncbi:MAG: hypothetical protein M5R42_21805, partial [Rhodocyclaceae bacterium]|nr:hypothetical protein [Rhodocyclaceae bacterium]
MGVGLLMNAGLPEWVASSPDDYVARAVSHASDLQRLAALRNGLRQQVLASPIFDAKRFAMHLRKRPAKHMAKVVRHSRTTQCRHNNMSLFDRFKSAGQAPGSADAADAAEQEALRLLEEGIAIEQAGVSMR